MSMDRNKNLKLFSLSNKKQMNLKKTEFVDVQLKCIVYKLSIVGHLLFLRTTATNVSLNTINLN